MSITGTVNLRQIALALINATNSIDVERVLMLFTVDAVISDPSTGHHFESHAGIRNYIEQYFIGYHTFTRFLSIKSLGESVARARVAFTGDYGREIGLLQITVNLEGLIVRIDADLE